MKRKGRRLRQRFGLDGSAFYDTNGDALSFQWFQYYEAGTLEDSVMIPAENISFLPDLKAPEVDSPKTAHFILKITDKGTPGFTRYKRVIVTIVPK